MLAALVEHWRRSTGGKDLPSRADLDLAALGPLLGHIFLIDVSPTPFRFSVREIGAKIHETFGRCYAGYNIDDPEAAYFEPDNVADYMCAVNNMRPHFTCGQARSNSGSQINYMRLLLPLSSDGVAVDMILGGVVTSMAAAPSGSDDQFLENAAEHLVAIAS
ncbi:MAG: PAS domain-containing protein [Alphaproteobacteria bacterium]|nr:PAS domain-containing protein [Alphaproteobacteria bacterium]